MKVPAYGGNLLKVGRRSRGHLRLREPGSREGEAAAVPPRHELSIMNHEDKPGGASDSTLLQGGRRRNDGGPRSTLTMPRGTTTRLVVSLLLSECLATLGFGNTDTASILQMRFCQRLSCPAVWALGASMPSFLIRDQRVDRFIPRSAAAP